MVVQNNSSTDLVSTPLKSDKKHRLKQRFDVQRKLGQGTYGKVQLAVNRETGQEVAIKTIKKSKIESEQDLIRIRREIQIMSSIQHPHIIHIYEVFENKDKIVLVMQFASGGELYDYLSEKKVLSDLEARRIFRQISAAIYYCHRNKICHRDLKLENILLDERGNAKIADFGLSNVFDEKNLLKTYCGSPLYASPEIVKGVPYYGPEVDCWSMGVLLYTLVYGAMPFDGSNFKKLVSQISEGEYFEPKKKSNATDLIRKLLTVDPSKRATIVDICVDQWVNLGYEHSLLQVAADMASLTPVRLDLLLALAPGSPVPQDEKLDKPLKSDSVTLINKTLDRDIPNEEEEEEEEDDDYNPDTAANSFAFMKGSRASQLSISSPNLQEAVDEYVEDSEDEFLPADIAAALQAECGKRLAESSFGSSLARISSLAHQNKKPKKSDSINVEKEHLKNDKKSESDKNSEKRQSPLSNKSKSDIPFSKSNISSKSSDKIIAESSVSNKSVSEIHKKDSFEKFEKCSNDSVAKEFQNKTNNLQASTSIVNRRESLSNQDDKETKRVGRPPGKIIIPKTFDSPQSTPSPKPGLVKKLTKSDSKTESENSEQSKANINVEVNKKEDKKKESSEISPVEDINKNLIKSDSKEESKENTITEEKKTIAKGILKKGIAKAKLAERRMSKQSSLDSEASSSCSTPPITSGTSEPLPSFYKAPKPYVKEEEANVTSKAEIKLSSTQSSNSTLKNEVISCKNAPLWDSSSHCNERKLVDKSQNWSLLSSAIDSDLSGWKEQMEESLRRLSPDDERSSNQSYSLNRIDDDKPLVPIARSYKKFTFTKDGACITETKKIYTTPGADGSWTKVEKKTKITTRPGNAEEFEKFRDLHLRNDSPCLTRSDSQSSSGSNEVYDDIFDSWTGDTMVCNMRKMNNMFQKFSKDPFLRKERRRNPFRFFRRTESERNDREKMRYEIRGGRSSDRDSENDEDSDLYFDDSSPVVYGSQGLWQFLRSTNRGFPGRVTIQHEPVGYGRSASQDRSESKCESHWKRSGSRASSGYNTGTRSQSRDRTESPREKVLRFVFESPRESFSKESSMRDSPSRQEKWSLKRNISRHNPRRDSGVGSDGYESEYSVRQSPSDEFSRAGRVSSMSSICSGGKQEMIKNFMKSWSKEFMSPPISPTSLGSCKEHSENFPESRKHRVEQWLHMNSERPFDVYSDGYPSINSRKSSTSPSNNSGYATMRPREYFQYNRSSSDKLSGCSDFFPSFEDSHRRRSQSLNKEAEAAKMRFRASTYSPVTEESVRETHSSHSNDSGSSVHQINFTFSDGRSTSSHTSHPATTRYVRHYSNSNEGGVESFPPASFRVEQVSPRTQPVVQMRVSFNRNNQDNQIVHVTSQSKGLWEQQESLTPTKPESNPREPSPVPGIRQFSTEVQHCVGATEEQPQMSVQCEVTNTGKQSPRNAQTGKNSPYKHYLPSETSIWDLACPPNCMDSELTNMNQTVPNITQSDNCFPPNDVINRPKKLLLLKMGYNREDAVNIKSNSAFSNGANTPDSLEDLTLEQQIRSEDAFGSAENFVPNCNEAPLKEEVNFQVDVKPLGVLWKSSNPQNDHGSQKLENGQCASSAQISVSPAISRLSDESERCDYQQRCLEKTSSEIGSIWNQKNTCQTFDLLKNLLSDDGLESFSSSKCVLSSSNNSQNYCSDSVVNENSLGQNQVNDKHISVIDKIQLERFAHRDKINKISIMDELQSPKEVLRQAMKICDSLEPIK